MDKLFREPNEINDLTDISCIRCGEGVTHMKLNAKATISLLWVQDNDYDCWDWEYDDIELKCTCGKVFPAESYTWEYEDDWFLRINPEYIEGENQG